MRTFVSVLFALGLIMSTGCQTTNSGNRDLIAQAAVVYATAKVIENNPGYAARIAEIAGHVRATAAGEGYASVDAALAVVRGMIDFTKLSPADAAVVTLLLDVVRAELVARLGEGILPPDKLLVVAKVAGWIENAAIASAP